MKSETESEKYLYNDELNADYLLKDIRKGDIIEYSYSLCGENPVYRNKFSHDFEVEFEEPVGKIYYRIIFPENNSVHIKSFKTYLEFTKSPNRNEYILNLANVKAIKPDKFLPSWYSCYGYFQFTEFNDWSDYAEWISGVFKNTESISAELSTKIKEFRKENRPDKDFVLACLRFVQDEIRYEGIEIGENDQKPYPPSQVFEQRFGDCKDKSLLLCTMLRNEGISADPVLVNTYYKKEVGSWLPSPSDFNHCIVKIKVDSKVYWVDPTIAYQRGSLDSLSFPDYELGLVVNTDSKSLEEIPQKIIGKTESSEKYMVADTTSASQLTVYTKYFGIKADDIRAYFADNSRTDIEKYYIGFYSGIYPKISMLDSVQYEDNETDNVFTTIEKYTIDDLWERTDNGWKAHFAADDIRSNITVPNSSLRRTPISLDYPLNFTQNIDIVPPEKWNATDESFSINQPGFEFNYRRNYSNGIIHLMYQLRITKDYIGTDQLDTYFKNTGKILDYIGYSLLWHPKIKPFVSNSTASGTNWIMVFVLILFLLFITLLFHKIYQFDFNISAYNAISKPIGGWLILVAIGLFFSPIRIIYWIFTSDYFNLEHWNLITNPDSSIYNPGRSALLIVELIGNVFIASCSIYLLILFFNKRTTFPKSVIGLYIFDFIFVFIDHIWAVNIGLTSFSNSSSWTHILRSVVPAVIWIPYFLNSERVKETFTRTYKSFSNNVAEIQSTSE